MNKNVRIIIIAIVVLGAGAYWFFGRGGTNTSTTNNTTGAVNCTEGDTITYSSGGGFSPSCLKVKSGATVTFKNSSSSDILIASNPHPVHTEHAILNANANLTAGQSQQVTLTQIGTYGYHNHLNAGQVGTIIVE